MDFISWLDDHIVSDKRLEGVFRNDVHLEDENDNVKIWVKGVGQAVVGILDNMGQWRILKEGGWYKTCDFIPNITPSPPARRCPACLPIPRQPPFTPARPVV